ncbi:asparagine synthase (glutamine-hydrolyzing) [Thiotrichales bacterium 19S3-7]|nr:asparagine synthase (glutamine-hydrolyzing) [Thiotrichales bacterium 19S3-7]MCF6800682.1 asparagine synthase (glutamine-hydrolyzing) [Thiotrichales bacterium 19S3-11]
MCGIAGIVDYNHNMVNESIISDMLKPLIHRGPDDKGVWCHQNIALGHQRLSIHDLSLLGHQPMLAHSKEWMIVYNGEIYNYLEIKKQLQSDRNITFNSNSDTEILINAIDIWGLEDTLKKCVGMFAFAALHIQSKCLYLARDRFGEKPLYYGIQNNVFAFASELKALRALSSYGWAFEIDRNALATYMRYSYVPTPYSIYQQIYKLEPGFILRIDAKREQVKYPYWLKDEAILSQKKFDGTYQQAVDLLEVKLKETLSLQMQADVPLGAFLSGGIDSSLIVALMQSISSEKINTFSIGFSDSEFNEANFAADIAKHLGTNHIEKYVTEQDALNVVDKLPLMYDEPFADSSQIPTFLVSEIAKSQVTVSLSGDAGDELFGGYNRYFFAEKIKDKYYKNSLMKSSIQLAPLSLIRLLKYRSKKHAQLTDKLFKLKNIFKYTNGENLDLYRVICSQLYRTEFVLGANEYPVLDSYAHLTHQAIAYPELMMFIDSKTYMMDDILTKVDRAAMAVSLETRVPFLDHRLYEFAWQLPIDYKIQKGVGKLVLRDLLYRYVPQKLIARPKMGFAVPLAKWLRCELKDWAFDLLNASSLQQQGYLDAKKVLKYWDEHLSAKNNWQAGLWNILMFQAWLEKWQGA